MSDLYELWDLVDTDLRRYTLPIQAVDTHRPKPKGLTMNGVVPTTAREYFVPPNSV